MNITEVISNLQNLTNLRIVKADIARILKIDPASLRRKELSGIDLKIEEIELIERHFAVKLREGSKLEDCIMLPVREDVEASMGYGAVVYNENQTATYSISKQLANDLGISVDSSEIIYGRGNSMEPTIIGGDALLIDKSKREVSDGRIYCIRYDRQLLTKRLQKLSRTKLKVISDNKDYEPITIDFETEKDIDFEIIGEVRWAGRVFK